MGLGQEVRLYSLAHVEWKLGGPPGFDEEGI